MRLNASFMPQCRAVAGEPYTLDIRLTCRGEDAPAVVEAISQVIVLLAGDGCDTVPTEDDLPPVYDD